MTRFFILFFSTFLGIHSIYSQNSNFLNFDSYNDYISTSIPSVFQDIENNSFTIELWIRPRPNPSESVVGMILQAEKDGFNDIAIYRAHNQLNFNVKYNRNNKRTWSSEPLPNNSWTHITLIWNSNSKESNIYVNGVVLTNLEHYEEVSQYSNGESLVNQMWIGTRGTFHSLNGSIDELRIWNGLRTPLEILNNMQNELVLPQTNLIAYYKFNQGIASGNNTPETTLVDTLNNYPGILHNFSLSGNTSNWINDNSLSNSKYNKNNTLNLYPNPASNFIKISGINGTEEIDIFDALGKKVSETIISNNKRIKIQNLSNGIYFIKFKNGNIKKLIKI
jgi:hypothetical protein